MAEAIQRFDILLVEDNSIDAEFAMRLLKKHFPGLNTFWVQDGNEAVDFIFGKNLFGKYGPREELRLVLLDLGLKKLSGLEVLKQIRRAGTTKTLPVVIITASQSEEDRDECVRLGVNGYLMKPLVNSEPFAQEISETIAPLLAADAPPGSGIH